ncbi:MAG: hypothetical protein H0U12_01185 [Thermoleophilaceae bacterium]|nr:hypothetical protein [Thermoleophilaceae bacterium]
MICTLTARRLKPGAYDDFRAAWSGGEEGRPKGAERWTSVYHCRDVEDENVVVSFGFFDGTLEQLRAAQEEIGREAQTSSVAEYIEEVLLDGSYEVVEELPS